MTATSLIFRAARRMYHLQTNPILTEDDAWNDAPDNCKTQYVQMAFFAFCVFGQAANQLAALDRGVCLCRQELRRDPVRTRSSSGFYFCVVCGGNCGD